MSEYKDKNKSKGEHGYKNNRGADAIGKLFGGLSGMAAKALKGRKNKTKERMKKLYDE